MSSLAGQQARAVQYFGMVGVDEVGRGCWAGPLLVVAARAKAKLPGDLKDSKLLSKKQRLEILNKLSICCDFGEGWVSPAEIDQSGLAKALALGIGRALNQLVVGSDEEIIYDGKVNYVPIEYRKSQAQIKADNLVPIVSAASIYAKVTRDQFMTDLSDKYPAYGFERHVGYGTKLHAQALARLGVIESIHRLSFTPVAKIMG